MKPGESRCLALLAALIATACAATGPGRVRLQAIDSLGKPIGGPARMVDQDLAIDLAMEEGAVELEIKVANRAPLPIQLRWDQAALVGPDHVQRPLRPTRSGELLPPGASVERHFAVGVALRDRARLELVLPTVVRDTPREYRIPLRARR